MCEGYVEKIILRMLGSVAPSVVFQLPGQHVKKLCLQRKRDDISYDIEDYHTLCDLLTDNTPQLISLIFKELRIENSEAKSSYRA